MLKELFIDNIAVIERAHILFERGLTVLTGETGAGKSILIDALLMVLGERASRDIIRSGCAFAGVTAVFDEIPSSVCAFLEEQGFSLEEDGSLLLRRRISTANKSQCFIGSQPCAAATMRSVGRMLVNIHGQHENQALLAKERHIEYLDRLGGLQDVHCEYEACYRQYCATHRALRKCTEDNESLRQREEMLRFQTSEIDAAQLQVGEEETLASRREILYNAEKIRRLLQMAITLFDGNESEGGAVAALEQGMGLLRETGRLLPQAQGLSERLGNALPELKDIAASCAELMNLPAFDPSELDAVEDRLALVRRLCDKYGGTAEAVLRFNEEAHRSLDSLERSDEESSKLAALLESQQQELVQAAARLTDARKRAATVFCTAVAEQLAFLDMPRVRLEVQIEPTSMTASGADRVEFLISANPGELPKPLAKIASGGELSRIMLALKSVMAKEDDIPTLIFDEIDAGISGHAASKVGFRLRHIGAFEGKQVLCVTHLAQIAASAHQQLLIEKKVQEDTTRTEVRAVEGEERCTELARIIGGDVTPLSLQTAAEMLERFPSLADEANMFGQ